jgi:GTP cyclohydrolase III
VNGNGDVGICRGACVTAHLDVANSTGTTVITVPPL